MRARSNSDMLLIRAALALLIAACTPGAGAAVTTASTQSGGDLYAAGASVQVTEPVAGDAVLAGGSVLVSGAVAQDVLAAGGSVTVTGGVSDDLRAAGGSVTVTDRIGGDAIAAGGSVTLAQGSAVAGNAWVAGGVLHLSGTVNGGLRAAGGEVIISGRIDGDAEVLAESLEVRPGAVIAGTLRHRGPAPAVISDDASIGEVVYTERRFEGPGPSILGGVMALLLVFVSLSVCTLLFAWLLPNVSRHAADNVRRRMALSLGVGLLVVVLTPILASALFVLMVTTPLAVALLASFVVLLIAGAFAALACLADWIRSRFLPGRGDGAGTRAMSVLAAGLAFWVVSLVPFLGLLLVALAFVTGAGALVLLAARLYKTPGVLPAG